MAEVTTKPLPVDQPAETITKPLPVDQRAEIITKPRPVAETETNHQFAIPATALGSVVDRTAMLSDELLESLEASERAAIEALGQFVIAIEEAFPQEVAGTSEVAKKITESGLQTADRLVHTQNEFLRNVIASTAKSLRIRDGAKPR